jgi:hypothetical protein
VDWSLENIKRGPRWLLLALHEMWLARRAAHWPTNEGTVQSVWLAPPEVLIVYACRWEGKLYSGSIRRGTITGAERMLHTYPKGGRCVVHVDPRRPSRPHSPSGLGWSDSLTLGLPGILIYVVAFVGLILFFTGKLGP